MQQDTANWRVLNGHRNRQFANIFSESMPSREQILALPKQSPVAAKQWRAPGNRTPAPFSACSNY